MFRKTIFASLLASSALTLAIATPAAAGRTERARDAIAAAEAKLHAAETLGAGTDAPRDTADARAALANAKEDFARGDREPAFRAATRASALADTAIGISQRRKDDAIVAAREDRRATADEARDQVAAAQVQAAAAQDQAVAAQQRIASAQQQAADANARAEAAQQSAAASAADAAAARNAAAIAAATPPAPQIETTITTHQPVGHRSSTRTKVIRRTTTTHAAPAPSADVTATTRVTPQ
jgi:hypothetical protein